MKIRNKSILALVLFGILDIISVFFPITDLLGIHIVYKRHEWFLKLVNDIYSINEL
jgi:hypothetical protein